MLFGVPWYILAWAACAGAVVVGFIQFLVGLNDDDDTLSMGGFLAVVAAILLALIIAAIAGWTR